MTSIQLARGGEVAVVIERPGADDDQQIERAEKIDRYCRVIFPIIFLVAAIAIFAHPRG